MIAQNGATVVGTGGILIGSKGHGPPVKIQPGFLQPHGLRAALKPQ
jgi:hypothetical protein